VRREGNFIILEDIKKAMQKIRSLLPLRPVAGWRSTIPELCVFIFLSSFTTSSFAQQDPLYSQYINNFFVINPAYAGMSNNLNAAISYRQQWSGVPGSPKTLNANGHISLMNNKVGAGLMLISDKIGYTTTNEALASYSYRIHLTKEKILAFGLQGGVANYQFDNSKLNPQDPSDPLFQGSLSQFKPSIGAGVILKNDKFFLGLSVPRMLKATFQAAGQQPVLYTQNIYLMGSYMMTVGDHLRLKPTVLLKKVNGSPLSVDVNVALVLNEKVMVGALTRNLNTYGVFLMATIKDFFRFGYVFEVPTSQSVGTNFTTNEIMLGIRMDVFRYHKNPGVMGF
jgi:type IX secretion system PorP/SprF family membrane protein